MPERLLRFGLLAGLVVFGIACAKDPEVAKREFVQSGDRYRSDGKLKEAIVEYRNAVQQDPRFAEAQTKLAIAYLDMGDIANAYHFAVRSADLLPNDVDAQLRVGRLLLLAGKYNDAVDRASKALAVDPRNIDAQILRASGLAGLKELDKALADLEEAVRIDPERAATHQSLGALQFLRGNQADAEAAFKQAVSVSPQSPKARAALATYYTFSGKLPAAEAEFKKTLELDANSELAHRGLALLYLPTRRAKEAEPHLVALTQILPSPKWKLNLADYYRNQRRLDDALRVLETLASTDAAGSSEAKVRLAGLRGVKDPTAALKLVEEVLAKDPSHVEALSAKTELLGRRGDFEGALAAIQTAAKAAPSNATVQFALGRVQQARAYDEEALAAYSEALRLNPTLSTAEVEIAKIHLAANRLDTAEQFVNSAVGKVPGHIQAHLVRARLYLMKGQVERAEQSVRLLSSAIPNTPEVLAELGQLELLKKRRPAARAAFEKALAANSNQIDALAGLVSMDIQDKRPDAAKARLTAAIERNPKNAALLMVSARTYSTMGDPATAERLARQTLQIDHKSLSAKLLLGELFIGQNRLDEAAAVLQDVVKQSPKLSSAHTALGVMYEMRGNREEAKRSYERALDADPKAGIAANNLAWIHSDSGGNAETALQLAKQAYARHPNQPQTNDTLGWMYYKKNLLPEAIKPLETSVRLAPENAVYHYHLGAVQAASGQPERARASLERALQLDAKFAGADDARKLLVVLRR